MDKLSLKNDDSSNLVALERARAADIAGVGQEFGCTEMAAQAVSDGKSLSEFRADVVAKMDRDAEAAGSPIGSYGNNAGMPADTSKYGRSLDKLRICDVILAQANPQKFGGGLVAEISADLERSMGRTTEGLFFPLEALQARAVSYGGTGSNLVETSLMDGQHIDPLYNASRVMQAGAQSLPGLTGNVAIPLQDGTHTGYWFLGDDSDAITESTPTFAQKTLEPHFLGYYSRYSLRTLTQSTPGIEGLVRNDQARGAGVTLDAAAIAGSGVGAIPLGIIGTSGIGSTTYANAGSPSFADVVGLETTIATANADFGGLSYLTTPAVAGGLKTSDIGTDTGQMVWTAGSQPGHGTLNGLPAYSSGNVTAGYIVCGDFSQLIVGSWGGLEVLVNPYDTTDFAKGTVAVRTILTADMLVRHAGAFAEIHEAAA